MTERVSNLQELATQVAPRSVTIVGHRFDIACHDLRDFLARNQIAYRWLDPTRRQRPGDRAASSGRSLSVVILRDGEKLVTPTLRELAAKLGLQTVPSTSGVRPRHHRRRTGRAWRPRSIGASEGLNTILIEREAPGGRGWYLVAHRELSRLSTAVPGDELSARALQQARRFGAELLVARDVVALDTAPQTRRTLGAA